MDLNCEKRFLGSLPVWKAGVWKVGAWKVGAWLAGLMLCLSAAPAGAVVVAGGDNGWEVSFDGNVNGFLVYEDGDEYPQVTRDAPFRFTSTQIQSLSSGTSGLSARTTPLQGIAPRQQVGRVVEDLINTVAHVALSVLPLLFFLDSPVPEANSGCDAGTDAATNRCHLTLELSPLLQGGTIGNNTRASRVRTGLLPAFFSFNVRSPEVAGLRGSARISFAPQIQNANTKNQFGSQVDLREVFFNVDGDFGTLSVGRTLSLFQRQNILNDMTLFGVGVNGGNGAGGGGTALGRIGYGYVYPQFNARISYKTPNVNGFQGEVGVYDPSKICHEAGTCATRTKTPRLETELTYATSYGPSSFLGWFGAMWQEAENFNGDNSKEVTAWGISGGLRVNYSDFALTATGYTGEALGSVLMLDSDSLDRKGNERDNHGWYVQGTYALGSLTLGASYGENNADLTGADRRPEAGAGILQQITSYIEADNSGLPSECQQDGVFTGDPNATPPTATISSTCANALETGDFRVPLSVGTPVNKLSSLTFGAYYDVTSWFKLIAEYSRVTNEWHSWPGLGQDLTVDSNVFSVGSFFTW